MPELNVGDIAPAFALQTDSGQQLELASLRGSNVILYFYPKADTPGCTTEACEFRDRSADMRGVDAVVLGVSPDNPAALEKFKNKFHLPFTLLSDPDHQVAEAYGVWKEKSMYGKKYFGIERTTFLIDREGRITNIFRKVKPAGHAGQVLEALGA